MISSSEEMWRLFVAIPLTDDIRRAATTLSLDLQATLDRKGWRWVAPDALHLTLAFIGNPRHQLYRR
jgi:2'-5' RNA ligase